MVLWLYYCRQGKYEYKKGTAVVIEEVVKPIIADSVGLSADTAQPMDLAWADDLCWKLMLLGLD
jgi:hypothetical protein